VVVRGSGFILALLMVSLWCLMQLSTIFQLYRGAIEIGSDKMKKKNTTLSTNRGKHRCSGRVRDHAPLLAPVLLLLRVSY
jgi:hypothetical protein